MMQQYRQDGQDAAGTCSAGRSGDADCGVLVGGGGSSRLASLGDAPFCWPSNPGGGAAPCCAATRGTAPLALGAGGGSKGRCKSSSGGASIVCSAAAPMRVSCRPRPPCWPCLGSPPLLLLVSCCSAAVAAALLFGPAVGLLVCPLKPFEWPFAPFAARGGLCILPAAPPGCLRLAEMPRAAGGCDSARGSYDWLPGGRILRSPAAVPAARFGGAGGAAVSPDPAAPCAALMVEAASAASFVASISVPLHYSGCHPVRHEH